MIHDLSQGLPSHLSRYDVCVVGSGPAGLTIANELLDSGLVVCVLESGIERTSLHADALRAVESEGIQIKENSRERILGGTSTTWNGLSSPLDPIDLMPRPWLKVPGWPLSHDELLPWWEAAAERYGFPPLLAYGEEGFRALRATERLRPDWQDLQEKVFLAPSEPQNFGRELRRAFEGSNADLFLDATVIRLNSQKGSAKGPVRVESALVCSSTGAEMAFHADRFVVAAGGVENARLLLNSRDACQTGLGNEQDQVGRYLMNHPKDTDVVGVVRFARPIRSLPFYFGSPYRGWIGYAGLKLREEKQLQLKCLNSYVRLEPLYPWSESDGVRSLLALVKSTSLFRWWKRRRGGEPVEPSPPEIGMNNGKPHAFFDLVSTILRELPVVMRYVFDRLARRGSPPVRVARVRTLTEMEPNPSNRLILGERRDANGQRIPIVRHTPSELDRKSVIVLHHVLKDELERTGVGTLESSLEETKPWPIVFDASHHMGTTRMGTDPSTSVVDPNQRVHNVSNLYMAGTSVFPTSGCANPTFTMVAMSIRLANHLRGFASSRSKSIDSIREEATHESSTPPKHGARERVLIIGAGRRVQSDVVPVFERLEGAYEISGILARHEGTITSASPGGPITMSDGKRSSYQTKPLIEIGAGELATCDVVYIAVPAGSVPTVLETLIRHDVSHIRLVMDTPILLPRDLNCLKHMGRFRDVWVGEDCSELPWLDVVRIAVEDGPLGTIQEVVCDKSAYRYHGLAMIRTLLGDPNLESARRVRSTETGTRIELQYGEGLRATIIQPRDYSAGVLTLRGESCVVSDSLAVHPDQNGSIPVTRLEPILSRDEVSRERNLAAPCTGFRLGDHETTLGDDEVSLLPLMRPGESLTTRMHDMKRVGLLRLLRELHESGVGYRLAQGLEDMVVDYMVMNVGWWKRSSITDVSRPAGRSLLTLLGHVRRYS